MSEHSSQALIGRLAACLLLMAPFLSAGQAAPAPASGEPGVRVPGFWDPRRRPEKPDLSRIRPTKDRLRDGPRKNRPAGCRPARQN